MASLLDASALKPLSEDKSLVFEGTKLEDDYSIIQSILFWPVPTEANIATIEHHMSLVHNQSRIHLRTAEWSSQLDRVCDPLLIFCWEKNTWDWILCWNDNSVRDFSTSQTAGTKSKSYQVFSENYFRIGLEHSVQIWTPTCFVKNNSFTEESTHIMIISVQFYKKLRRVD